MPAQLRSSISLKIFSIAVTLVVLMAIVAALSTRNVDRVSTRVNALSKFYLPLQRSMEDARVSVASQVINLERMLLTRTLVRDEKKALQEHEKLFLERGEEADRYVLSAIALADRAIQANGLPSHDVELLVRLRDKELPDVLAARKHLHEQALKYVQELNIGDRRAIQVFRDVIADERARLSKEVNDVVLIISDLAASSAQAANMEQARALYMNWGITLAAALLGLMLAALITRGLVRPVKDLVNGTKAVERGELDIVVRVRTTDELAILTDSFNHMVSEIKEKKSITETFGKYVDPRIVKRLLEGKGRALEGEKRVMTVFFSDVEGFTSLCEQLTPDGAVRCLNKYFSLASIPIREANGIIDKYIGDAIMAFWGPPFTDEHEHASLACRAALAQLERLEELKRALPDVLGLRKGLPKMNVRVGLATGDVIVGNIGSETTKGYTVIGDTVNLASRLEGANKLYGTRLLVSNATADLVQDSMETREIDAIRVVGKTEPVQVHELLGLKGALDPLTAKLRDEFSAGLGSYRRCEWAAAQASFTACLALKADDGPSNVYVARVRHFTVNPPPREWDGAWSLAEK
jgi:adenylate cyclase